MENEYRADLGGFEEPFRMGAANSFPPPSGEPVGFAANPSPQAQQARPARRESGKNWIYIIIITVVVAIFAVTMFSVGSCASTVSGAFSGLDRSKSIESPDSTPKVGVIDIGGTIQYDGTSCSPEGLRTLLQRAEDRNDIRAIVLRVNSGGGTATAGEEMAHYVADFKKPVVVSSASINASAAYEISSQADYIFTSKTTALGAIGTAIQITDLSGLYSMLGINIEYITSTNSKDSSYGARPLTEEERAYYQNMIDQVDLQFRTTVAQGREMSLDEVTELANGLTYTGTEAVDNGLADEIGYFEDAVHKASNLAGFEESLQHTYLTLGSEGGLAQLLDILGSSQASSDEKALDALARRFGTQPSTSTTIGN